MAEDAQLDSLTTPFIGTFVPVPKPGVGVCDICHGAPSEGYPRCYSCNEVMTQVSHPTTTVVPITLAGKFAPMYDLLKRYKSPYASEGARTHARLRVGALLLRFLGQHSTCVEAVAGSHWDYVTSVPSTSGRVGTHPLEDVIRMSATLGPNFRSTLQKGPADIAWNNASDHGFKPTDSVSGDKILVIDDLFTTGSRAQSAASALTMSGATVVGVIVVGRFIKADFPEPKAMWEKYSQILFSFDDCCVH